MNEPEDTASAVPSGPPTPMTAEGLAQTGGCPATMSRMWESELELRDALTRTVQARHPRASAKEIKDTVDRFLAFDDCQDDLPQVWKYRWHADREARRNGQ